MITASIIIYIIIGFIIASILASILYKTSYSHELALSDCVGILLAFIFWPIAIFVIVISYFVNWLDNYEHQNKICRIFTIIFCWPLKLIDKFKKGLNNE